MDSGTRAIFWGVSALLGFTLAQAASAGPCEPLFIIPTLKSVESITPDALRAGPSRNAKTAAPGLADADVSEIVTYLQSPTIARDPVRFEKKLRRREKQSDGQDGSLLTVYDNIVYGMELLTEYDAIHGTDHAAETGIALLRKLKANHQAHDYDALFLKVGRACLLSRSPEQVPRYFEAVFESRSFNGFVADSSLLAPTLSEQLLRKVSALGPELQPDAEKLAFILRGYVEAYRWMGERAGAAKKLGQRRALAQAARMSEVAEEYFASVNDFERAEEFALLSAELKTEIKRAQAATR